MKIEIIWASESNQENNQEHDRALPAEAGLPSKATSITIDAMMGLV